MTIREVIDRIDDLKPNVYRDEQKVRWISEIDARIYKDVFETHEGNPYTLIKPSEEEKDYIDYTPKEEQKIYLELPYTVDKASETELLAEFPHDELYVAYVEAKIDAYNNDTVRYQNNSALFNTLYNEYLAWYNRTHMPVERGKYEPTTVPTSPFK